MLGVGAALLMAAWFLCENLRLAPALAGDVGIRALRIDGTALTGAWLGADDRGIELATDRDAQRIALHDLMSVKFKDSTVTGTGGTILHLVDGGRLPSELIGEAADAVVVRTGLGALMTLPFGRLAGIQLAADTGFPRAAALFRQSLAERLPGQDVLVTRGPDDVKSLRGRLAGINPDRGSFEFGDRERSFQIDKIFGIVFASGVSKPLKQPLTVVLTDGSEFSGRLLSGNAFFLRVRSSFDQDIELPLDMLRDLRIVSDRVVYLSDLTARCERVEGRLHRSWPVLRDQNVAGGPITLGGTRFAKGLGVHSRTELTYELTGGFDTFVATIGLDDRVRPRGNVTFRVVGDARVLFDSGLLTGRDEPQTVMTDVSGVHALTLIVDYGDELDLSDQADWADARVIHPPPPTHEGGPAQ